MGIDGPAPEDPLAIAHRISRVFSQLGINHLIGGSLASSVHGIFRLTNDIDMVAEVREKDLESLASLLDAEFDTDRDMIRDAIRHRGSFNVIHRDSGYKVDVFIPRYDLWVLRQLERGRDIEIDPETHEKLTFTSPEDIILQKLVWFRLGGMVQEQQWRDVIGVLRVQAGSLEDAYLDEWAPALEVSDLLAKARAEASNPAI
jgi:hypothetical protein